MTRNRLLIWIILILLATNIATVVSVMVNSGRMNADRRARGAEMADARVMFFRDHLQLSESQMSDFIQLNRKFGQVAGPMTGELDQLRRNMIVELSETEPDLDKVEKITEEIGSLHKQLKQATTKYYLGLKGVCTPEQQELLKEIFMVMSDPSGDLNSIRRGPMGPGGPGQGQGRNMRGPRRGIEGGGF